MGTYKCKRTHDTNKLAKSIVGGAVSEGAPRQVLENISAAVAPRKPANGQDGPSRARELATVQDRGNAKEVTQACGSRDPAVQCITRTQVLIIHPLV